MLLKIAFRNVIVHWRQSLAAVLSISGAFFCFALFQGYMKNVRVLYSDACRSRLMYGDVLFENRDATSLAGRREPRTYALHSSDQAVLSDLFKRHAADIEQSARHLYFQGMVNIGSASKVFIGRATEPNEAAAMRAQWDWNTLYGKPLHVSRDPQALLLGQHLAAQMGCEPDAPKPKVVAGGGYPAQDRAFHCLRDDVQLSVSTATGNLNAADFTVTGLVDALYKDLDSRYVEVPLAAAQSLLASDDITFWAVKLKPSVGIAPWIDTVNAELKTSAPALRAVSWMDHPVGDLYRQSMSLLAIFGNFVSIVVAFISILSVMNTMVKMVSERTREIGTLLSLGFQRAQILNLFLQEAFFLGLAGVVLGAVGATLTAKIVNQLGITYKAGLLSEPVPFRILFSAPVYLLATVVLVAVTLLTCYVACRSAVHKKIVECLGHV